MSDLICVTNRKLAEGDFLQRIDRICSCKIKALVLREKDLPEEEYLLLSSEVSKICEKHGVLFIAHTYKAASKGALQLPLPFFEKTEDQILGTSIHSKEDLKRAIDLGATYAIAGHVFETDCKKGLPGRGLKFIEELSEISTIPIYAIGGITPENKDDVIRAGASGIAVMSGLMTCKNVEEYISAF